MVRVREQYFVDSAEEMKALAASFLPRFQVSQLVLLFGELGAGKTTFARGLIASAGWQGHVRSPSFSLLNLYDTNPKIAHADLYRLASEEDIGLEEAALDHIVLIEWAERFESFLNRTDCWKIDIEVTETGRIVKVDPPEELVP